VQQSPLDTYLITRSADSTVEQIFDAMVKLRPDELPFENLMEIVLYNRKYAQKNWAKNSLPYKHYCGFGTGGDGKIKTVNITTAACVIASYHVPVIKLSTKGVTSKWGGADTGGVSPLPFEGKSKLIVLSELGFDYNPNLLAARKMLDSQNLPDIYKVVFPGSQLTGADGVLTGVSKAEWYLKPIIKINEALGTTATLVHSETFAVDEFMPGTNRMVRIQDGQVTEDRKIKFGNPNDSQFLSYIGEKASVEQQRVFVDSIMQCRAPLSCLETIAWNAAGLVQFSCPEQPLEDVAATIIQHMNHMAYYPHITAVEQIGRRLR
jgi:anthranilate phosphoribosyltransferase